MIFISKDTRTVYIVTNKNSQMIGDLILRGFVVDPRSDNEALQVYLTRNGKPVFNADKENVRNELLQRYNSFFCVNCNCYLASDKIHFTCTNCFELFCDLCADKCLNQLCDCCNKTKMCVSCV
jgi:hypothetical protein